jgi:hypothetical protein
VTKDGKEELVMYLFAPMVVVRVTARIKKHASANQDGSPLM